MSSKPDEPTPPPARPISTESVPWETWGQGVRFGTRYRHLTSKAVGDAYHVGVQLEELPPGKRSAPAHYHLGEEEHLLVLEGSCTLQLGAERHTLVAGDYVCFPAGQRAGHYLANEGAAPCRVLVIGERRPDDVVVYTDSNKVMVRALRQIFDGAATRSYWDGEPTE
jgi:uncharacterized cupin superfamily protein